MTRSVARPFGLACLKLYTCGRSQWPGHSMNEKKPKQKERSQSRWQGRLPLLDQKEAPPQPPHGRGISSPPPKKAGGGIPVTPPQRREKNPKREKPANPGEGPPHSPQQGRQLPPPQKGREGETSTTTTAEREQKKGEPTVGNSPQPVQWYLPPLPESPSRLHTPPR